MTGGAAVTTVTTTTMAVNVIARQINYESKPTLTLALRNLLNVVAKNTLAPTVKIELALQVSLAKVKVRKPVLIDLPAKQAIKALMQNQVKVPKMRVSETVKVQPHVALDVESRDKYEYIY